MYRQLRQGVTVEWFDNFNRYYVLGNPTLNSGAIWTVHAFRVPARSCHIDISLGTGQETMPSDVLSAVTFVGVHKFLLQNIYRDSHLADGLGEVLSVNRVPVKPDIANCQLHPRITARIRERGSSMKFFHAVGIEGLDIGSNRGLLRLVKGWMDEDVQRANRRLRIICVDIDIYFRIMKVRFICAYEPGYLCNYMPTICFC